MRTRLHRWLPTVLALLALVIALGGPAEARKLINGKLIKPGTVATKQLKDGGVTGADLADGAISGADVADGSLGGADVGDGSLTGSDLKPGAIGPDQLADDGVTTADLQANAVQGRNVDAAGFVDLNFASIAALSCASQTITVPAAAVADGDLLDDVVVVTPSAFVTGNFTFSARTDTATSIVVRMCNVGATAADPDGSATGKTWRYAALDID